YANTLNALAKAIFHNSQNGTADPDQLKQSAEWAKKGMALSENREPVTWTTVGDTYAHLMATLGNKAEAITTQQAVVKKAKDFKLQDTENFESFLKALQN